MAGIQVGTVATIWQDANGDDYLVIIHEALYFGDRMSSSLLCPNQLRDHGNIVDDVPRQSKASSTHSIYVPSQTLRLPLSLDGSSLASLAGNHPGPNIMTLHSSEWS